MNDKAMNLLLIEDNPDDAVIFREILKETGFTACSVHWEQLLSGGKAYLDKNKIDIVMLDLSLPDSRGIDSVSSIKSHVPELPLVVLTGLEDEQMGERAIREGAQDYLSKDDMDARLLENSIRYAIERQQLVNRLEEKRRELVESEERQRKIIENTVDGIIVLGKQERVLFMNKAAENLLGRTSDELVGKYFGFPILSQPSMELTIVRKGGGIAFAEMRLVEIQWEGEDALLASLRDISSHKRLEQELLAEKERLEVTLRSIADGVIAIDRKGKIVLINSVVRELTGCSRDKARGRTVNSLLKIKDKTSRKQLNNILKQVLKSGEILESTGETILTGVKGKRRTIEYSCAPVLNKEKQVIGTVLVVRDTTDTQKMKTELEKAQTLESMGVLAGGLAHEYNNALTGILGDLSMIKRAVGQVDKNKENRVFEVLLDAEDGALRLKELTQRLLTFSRGGAPRKTPGSLLELLREITGFMSRDKDPDVKFRWKISGDIWTALFDKDQLNLAIRNILDNAVEAMSAGAKKTGTITITLENRTVSHESPLLLPIETGNYVKVTIADQGAGIAKEHLGKIFDPYFTTKRDKSGMGLTIAYSILKKHGGVIDVTSRTGKGSSFSLFLPAGRSAVSAPSPVVDADMGIDLKDEVFPSKPPGEARGVVLLMDDEEDVREVVREMLKELGYKTITAAEGREVLQIYKKSMETGDPIDLVILDLLVSVGMGGEECVKKLRHLDPNVTVVLSSGYADDPAISRYRDYGFDYVLPKPYQTRELSRLLTKIMKK